LEGVPENIKCITPAATANTAPTQATVDLATDIYDKPDGKGQKIGTLYPGEVHPLMEPCRDDWCRVGAIELGGFEGLPNGTAWVYSKGFLTFS
jgi:SH3-like domain-containing protein